MSLNAWIKDDKILNWKYDNDYNFFEKYNQTSWCVQSWTVVALLIKLFIDTKIIDNNNIKGWCTHFIQKCRRRWECNCDVLLKQIRKYSAIRKQERAEK